MRWRDGRRSDNVEDRRGQTSRYAAAGAGSAVLLRFLPMLFRSKMGRTILIVGVILIFGGKMLGIDILPFLLGGGSPTTVESQREFTEAEQELADFTSVVLADTEDTWKAIFAERGADYREPTLVLFTGQVQSACGFASAAVGPFYCPGDEKVYIDLTFFDDLARRFGAPGDFAQAYVLAHEVGHHVQTVLGISQEVRRLGQGRSKQEVNALSVRQELQADCFAGVWGHIAHRERQILEPGDLDEALQAATAIGDDRLQRQAGGQVVPDSFTHGTSEQRARWFRRGFETGNIDNCNTFEARQL
ncbi:neutral zinc metallopeptidase [Marinobacter salinisoli]|uniref:Neutral zinc metallopeptidase n=1 Tax=Marinobacter salinisoli TaxID=2769486 RepID=A0ABX7MQJ6_9GAMM|nr:neutral zinc metallopeptidase [Marinobacter salinisoli]QSP94596.1 neutral zinc metallopeptidase [Marinobacter salinisoli]